MKRQSFVNVHELLLPILLLLIAACSDTGLSPVDLEHRLRWESLGIHDYTIQQQKQCNCTDAGRTVEIVVRADTIFSVTVADSLPYPLLGGQYLTVKSLFDFIEVSRTIPSAHIDITYNSQYGYPERVFVDRLPNAVDDEIAYVISAFAAIR